MRGRAWWLLVREVLKYAPKGLPFPGKDYLEHILARWCDAGGRATKFWRRNDEREKGFEWACGDTDAAASDRRCGDGMRGTSSGCDEELGGSGGGNFAYGGGNSPGAGFQGEPETHI